MTGLIIAVFLFLEIFDYKYLSNLAPDIEENIYLSLICFMGSVLVLNCWNEHEVYFASSHCRLFYFITSLLKIT